MPSDDRQQFQALYNYNTESTLPRQGGGGVGFFQPIFNYFCSSGTPDPSGAPDAAPVSAEQPDAPVRTEWTIPNNNNKKPTRPLYVFLVPSDQIFTVPQQFELPQLLYGQQKSILRNQSKRV